MPVVLERWAVSSATGPLRNTGYGLAVSFPCARRAPSSILQDVLAASKVRYVVEPLSGTVPRIVSAIGATSPSGRVLVKDRSTTLCGRSSALAASRNTPPRITLLRRRRVPISAPAPGAVVLVSCPIASITRCQIAAPTASPSAVMVVTGTGGVIRPPNAVADQSVWLAPDCVLRASAVLRAAVPAAHRQTSPECRAAT